MSRAFRIGRRRWLYVSIAARNTFRSSAFGRRYLNGNHFLWFDSLHFLYTPELSLHATNAEEAT